jgi:hypothetical protein
VDKLPEVIRQNDKKLSKTWYCKASVANNDSNNPAAGA